MAKLSFHLGFLSKTVISFAIIFLIFDVVILWVVIKPQLPSFQLNSAVVSSLSTTTDAELTAVFDVAVIVRNPNHDLHVSYKSVEVAAWFGHRSIASASVEPFWQVAGSETPVRARFGVERKPFPRGVINGVGEQRGRGSVDFGVTMVARVKFWWGPIVRTRARSLTVECYPLNLVFPPNHNINNNNDTGRLVAPYDCYQV
ncbi:NDR1/HIN1-like protein 6, partial [Mucuna pruriens]